MLKRKQRVSNQLVHISDWLPTFAHLAGIKPPNDIDGLNIWDALSLDLDSPRHEVLCNYDELIPYGSYIRDEWKYINGTTYEGTYDHWLPNIDTHEKHTSFEHYGQSVLESEVGRILFSYEANENQLSANEIEKLRILNTVSCKDVPIPLRTDVEYCDPMIRACLFNILNDPCERQNIASNHPEVMSSMEKRMIEFTNSAIPPRNKPRDVRSNPINFNYTWTWWYDELGLTDGDYDDENVVSSSASSFFSWINKMVMRIL